MKAAKGLEIDLVMVKDLLLGTSELGAPVLNRRGLGSSNTCPKNTRPTAKQLIERAQEIGEVA